MLEKFRSNLSQFIAPNKRSVDLTSILKKNQSQTTNVFDFDTPIQSHEAIVPLCDQSIDPVKLFNMMENDSYVSPLYDQLVDSIFKNELYIENVKDEKGNIKGDKRTPNRIKKLLYDNNYNEIVEEIIESDRGSGGGNCLLFSVKDRGKLKFLVEPFYSEGKHRVQVTADRRNKRILYYEVIDDYHEPVYKLNPARDYVFHIRYRQSGHFVFSRSPAKRALGWYILKSIVGGSTLARFNNGFQDNVLMSPDYAAIKYLTEALEITKKAGSQVNDLDYLDNPLKYLGRQSMLDEKVLQSILGNHKETNKLLKMHMPYTFQRVDRNVSEMKVKEMIDKCNEEMGYALRLPKSVLSSKDAKYSNAETEQDVWHENVLDPLKAKIEKITENIILPVLEPGFNKELYRVRFGRDPNAEDLERWKIDTERNESIGRNLAISEKLSLYSFNINTNTWEQLEKPKDLPKDSKQKIQEDLVGIEEDDKKERNVKKKSIKELQKEFYL